MNFQERKALISYGPLKMELRIAASNDEQRKREMNFLDREYIKRIMDIKRWLDQHPKPPTKKENQFYLENKRDKFSIMLDTLLTQTVVTSGSVENLIAGLIRSPEPEKYRKYLEIFLQTNYAVEHIHIYDQILSILTQRLIKIINTPKCNVKNIGCIYAYEHTIYVLCLIFKIAENDRTANDKSI